MLYSRPPQGRGGAACGVFHVIRKRKLPSGLTLLTETMPHVRSVSLGIWLKQGSRHETPSMNGASHFLEHLVFKGTKTRSAREIALAADSVGMQLDAFTTKEYTCFYVKTLDEHLDRAIDLLSDIVLNPAFDAEELERERKVVLEEIRMVDDTPDDTIYDLFAEQFWPNHSLGRPIQGTEKSVAGMSRRGIQNFFRDSYRPDRMMVVAAGSLDAADLGRKVRRAFGTLDATPSAPRRSKLPRAHGGIVRKKKPDLEQLHLLMGLPVFPESHDERYTLHVLNTLLGGTMSSRLFQRIREERGLAYSVFSGVNLFHDSGFLMIYAGTSPDRGREAIELSLVEMADLRDDGPTQEELTVAKEHLKGSLMLSLESTSSRMSNLARQEIYYGRRVGLESILRGIDRVTTHRVQSLARKLFASPPISLAVVGNLSRFKMTDRMLAL